MIDSLVAVVVAHGQDPAASAERLVSQAQRVGRGAKEEIASLRRQILNTKLFNNDAAGSADLDNLVAQLLVWTLLRRGTVPPGQHDPVLDDLLSMIIDPAVRQDTAQRAERAVAAGLPTLVGLMAFGLAANDDAFWDAPALQFAIAACLRHADLPTYAAEWYWAYATNSRAPAVEKPKAWVLAGEEYQQARSVVRARACWAMGLRAADSLAVKDHKFLFRARCHYSIAFEGLVRQAPDIVLDAVRRGRTDLESELGAGMDLHAKFEGTTIHTMLTYLESFEALAMSETISEAMAATEVQRYVDRGVQAFADTQLVESERLTIVMNFAEAAHVVQRRFSITGETNRLKALLPRELSARLEPGVAVDDQAKNAARLLVAFARVLQKPDALWRRPNLRAAVAIDMANAASRETGPDAGKRAGIALSLVDQEIRATILSGAIIPSDEDRLEEYATDLTVLRTAFIEMALRLGKGYPELRSDLDGVSFFINDRLTGIALLETAARGPKGQARVARDRLIVLNRFFNFLQNCELLDLVADARPEFSVPEIVQKYRERMQPLVLERRKQLVTQIRQDLGLSASVVLDTEEVPIALGLKPDEGVLSLAVTADTLACWVLTPGRGVTLHTLPLKDDWSAPEWARRVSGLMQSAPTSRASQFDSLRADDVVTWLASVVPTSVKRLYVAAPREFNTVCFEGIPLPLGGLLGERVDVSYIPSVHWLVHSSRAIRAEGPRRLVAVVSNRTPITGATSRAAPDLMREARAFLKAVGPVAGAEPVVFGDESRLAESGTPFTMHGFRAATASDHILYFGCHGVFVPGAPMSSRFLIGGKEEAVDLSALDLMTVDLSRCGLAILSACSAGATGGSKGGDILGLVRPFLVSGSASVICPIDDVLVGDTEQFMQSLGGRLSRTTGSDAFYSLQRDLLSSTYAPPWEALRWRHFGVIQRRRGDAAAPGGHPLPITPPTR